MSRRVYANKILIEKWDDETQTYSGPKGSRPYTAEELAAAGIDPPPAPDAEVEQIREAALSMADGEESDAVKSLAEAVALLAERHTQNRRDVDALIRKAR